MRIYPRALQNYMDFFDTLPSPMMERMVKAGDCKRLLTPEACNPKCAMVYDFLCRVSAFKSARIVHLCFRSAKRTIHSCLYSLNTI